MNSDRFLNAVVQIEQLLKSEAGVHADIHADLQQLIDRSHRLNKQHKSKLHAWRKLRNAIVHNTKEGANTIAEPRDDVVKEIERLLEILKNPPRASQVLNLAPPRVLDAEAEISEFFAELLPPKDFSQSPFRARNNEYRLITSNAVARWAAASYEATSGALIDSASVETVAGYCEEDDRLVVARQDITAQEIIDLLTAPDGVPPAAVLLTDTGHHAGKAMGLAVKADLPFLYRAVSLQ